MTVYSTFLVWAVEFLKCFILNVGERRREEVGVAGVEVIAKHKTERFTHYGGRLLTLCLLSICVTLGFKLHWGSSVQQDVSCLLLMHCCKVFDVHYRLKKKNALCILHQCHRVSSSMVLNIASISNVWKMYGFPVFFSLLSPSMF